MLDTGANLKGFRGFTSVKDIGVGSQYKDAARIADFFHYLAKGPVTYVAADWGGEGELMEYLRVVDNLGLDYSLLGLEQGVGTYPPGASHEEAELRGYEIGGDGGSRLFDPNGEREAPESVLELPETDTLILMDDWVTSGTSFRGAAYSLLERRARGLFHFNNFYMFAIKDYLNATHATIQRENGNRVWCSGPYGFLIGSERAEEMTDEYGDDFFGPVGIGKLRPPTSSGRAVPGFGKDRQDYNPPEARTSSLIKRLAAVKVHQLRKHTRKGGFLYNILSKATDRLTSL